MNINNTVKLPMEIRLRWFQYRIIHRIIGTNSFLCKIGIIDSPLCTFCKESSETILHLFVGCRVVGQLVQDVALWLEALFDEPILLTDSDIILGRSKYSDRLLNYLLILLKYYIYKQRARNTLPVLIGFKKDLEYYYNLEKYIYMKNCREPYFKKKWKVFCDLFDRPDTV
jgi:hypothetical protein